MNRILESIDCAVQAHTSSKINQHFLLSPLLDTLLEVTETALAFSGTFSIESGHINASCLRTASHSGRTQPPAHTNMTITNLRGSVILQAMEASGFIIEQESTVSLPAGHAKISNWAMLSFKTMGETGGVIIVANSKLPLTMATIDLMRPVAGFISMYDASRRTTAALEAMVNVKVKQLTTTIQILHDMADKERDVMSQNAHEIRTPAQSVVLAAEMLAEGDASMLGVLRNGVNSLQAVVNTILTKNMDRDIGNRSFDVEFNMYALLVEEVDALRPLAKAKNITVTLNKFSACIITTNRQGLKQCVNNVISNAIKYCRSRVDCGIAITSTEKLCIVIEDDGTLDDFDMELCFTPYYRAATVGTTPGTGLGLFNVKRMMSQMGGTAVVANNPTKFTLELPCPRKSELTRVLSRSSPSSSPSIKCHVLVVEDNEINRRLLCHALRGLHHSYYDCATVSEATQELRQTNFHVAILDRNLAVGESGLEVAEYITLHHPETRIIIASADDTKDIASPGYLYLPKPFGSSDLKKMLSLV